MSKARDELGRGRYCADLADADADPDDDADADADTDTDISVTQDLTPGVAAGRSPPVARPAMLARRYQLGDKLGIGGMGEVYAARDTELDRQVAIKFMKGLDSRRARRFREEARALARVLDASTVTIYDVGESDGRPYLVYEYVPGHSLDRERLPIHWRAALRYGIEIARGLAAVHRQGVLHCDVKPANVMVTVDDRIKLIDFGLAEMVAHDARTSSSPTGPQGSLAADSRPGNPRGTTPYIAPERWRGAPPTPQADVYALGAVLYELCTGKKPAPADGRAAPARTNLGPSVDAGLVAVIERCLAFEPDDRFAAGGAVNKALQAVQARLDEPSLPDNPYRGLAPFESGDRHLFFGRDGDIRAILADLADRPLALLIGDSGVGKSSLARAGVLPRVRDGALLAGRAFHTPVMTPGHRPLDTLARILSRELGLGIDSVADELGAGELSGLARRIGQRHDQHKVGTLLFVDQMEELATVSEPEQAALFGRFLAHMASADVPGWRALAAVRADHLTRLAHRPGLSLLVTGTRPSYVFPLDGAAIRAAVVVPAKQLGYRFESEALVAELVAAGCEQGGLPLLQFVLDRMWSARDQDRHLLTDDSLRAMGGVGGALARHADSVLASLDESGSRAARSILLALLTDQRTRRRRALDDLAPPVVSPAVSPVASIVSPAQRALDALVAGRLVVAHNDGGTPEYEIAHEALVEQWPQLRRWLERGRERAMMRESLVNAARFWQRLGRPRSALWQRVQVDEADELLGPVDQIGEMPDEMIDGLIERERAFLVASRRAARWRRGVRWLAALAVIGALAVAAAYVGKHEVDKRQSARAARESMSTAQQAFAEGRSGHALFTAMRARVGAELASEEGANWLTDIVWQLSLELAVDVEQRYYAASFSLDSLLARDLLVHEARDLRAQVVDAREDLAMTLGDRRRGDAPLHVGVGESVADARARTREPDRTCHGGEPMCAIPTGTVLVGYGTGLQHEFVRLGLNTVPLHRRQVPAFAIARHEATYGEWLAYQESVRASWPAPCAGEPMTRTHADIKVTLACWHHPTKGFSWQLTWTDGEDYSQTVDEEQPLVFGADGDSQRRRVDWLNAPVIGVSADEAREYAAWLARGRIPGARLCTEVEWERAARGDDGRAYPHGEELSPEQANIDATYGKKVGAYGPDEVCRHEQSSSPFGVCDMAGNVWEHTVPVLKKSRSTVSVLRGGSYYQPDIDAHAANRWDIQGSQAPATVGVRICSDR